MSIRWRPEVDSWRSRPCRQCGDASEVGSKYCATCERDREVIRVFVSRDDAKHEASHQERGAS